jgi:hypothetical protein
MDYNFLLKLYTKNPSNYIMTDYEDILKDFDGEKRTELGTVGNTARSLGVTMNELADAMARLNQATLRRMPRRVGMLMIQLYQQDASLPPRETTYPGYSHQLVAMNSDMWRVRKSEINPPHAVVYVTNIEAITFPECGSSSMRFNVTHFGIQTMEGIIVHMGELDSPLAITQGDTPEFAPGSISIQEDGFSKWYDLL